MALSKYLKTMVDREASDLYLTVKSPPMIKVYGELHSLENTPLTSDQIKEIAHSIMNEAQRAAFEKNLEMNLAIAKPEFGRFRVNIYQQKNETALVIRYIKPAATSITGLGLPAALETLALEKRGLILFVGATGSGKSTSLSALLNYRNTETSGHIITIEDPIEFLHEHKKSIVSQREIGIDTAGYKTALENALRQSPDVILIGEIRTREAMEYAIAFSETGHLVLSTLHANNANQAIERIITFFEENERQQILLDLSFNLRAIVSQRLIPDLQGKRTIAVELLLGTSLISDLIKRGEINLLKETIEKSEHQGMQTFDGALFALFKSGKISREEALKNSDSQTNLELRMNLTEGVKGDASKKFSIRRDKDAGSENTENKNPA